jgi:hypothetical protein
MFSQADNGFVTKKRVDSEAEHGQAKQMACEEPG